MDNKINLWLQKFDIVNKIAKFEDIHSERLTDNVKNLAMQRTGTQDMDLDYVGDKGWKKQYQYMLFLKSESEDDKQRLTNMDWLDDLTEQLYQAKMKKNFPNIGENKKITNVSCANAITYQESDDGAISVYSLQIYFDVRGGIMDGK